jgi:hypothetical protein
VTITLSVDLVERIDVKVDRGTVIRVGLDGWPSTSPRQ